MVKTNVTNEDLVNILAKNESDDFYDGVISIVNSDMWSSDKRNAILEIANNN